MPQEAPRSSTIGYGQLPDRKRSYLADLRNHYKDFSEAHYSAIQVKRENALQKQTRKYRIVIVGGGPAGLVAAYEAYTRGFNVSIIEKRVYTRDQILRLSVNTYRYVTETLGTPFTTQLVTLELVQSRRQGIANRDLFPEGNFHTIEVRDFENSFATMLQVLSERDPEGISFYSEHTFTAMQKPTKENNSWHVQMHDNNTKQNIEIPADIVIGADGSRSFVHSVQPFTTQTCSTECTYGAFTFEFPENLPNIFVELGVDVPQIVYDGHELSKTVRKNSHLEWMKQNRRRTDIDAELEVLRGDLSEPNLAAYSLLFQRIASSEQVELEFIEKGVKQHLQFLKKEFGWQLDRIPISRFFSSAETVYIGCEFPDKLLKDLHGKDRDIIQEQLVKWSKAVLKSHLPNTLIDQLKPRHGSAFPLSLNKTNNVHARLHEEQKGLHLFSLGDAYVTPHFLTGSGAQHAINMSRRLGDLFSQIHENGLEETDFSGYEAEMRATANELHAKAYKAGLLKPLSGSCQII